jgi:hypothetical protein
MKRKARIGMAAALLVMGTAAAHPQDSASAAVSRLTETGRVATNGRTSSYVIRRLPPSSFPDLSPAIAGLLDRRGCLIPQTYQAHHPENVVRAALERPGSVDWAVLCSVKGNVSLMVFFGSAPEHPITLATAPENERLQVHDLSGVLGFNWAIDPASPTRVHQAQSGIEPRPLRLDHDALADSVIDHRTVFHFYTGNKWTLVDLPE